MTVELLLEKKGILDRNSTLKVDSKNVRRFMLLKTDYVLNIVLILTEIKMN